MPSRAGHWTRAPGDVRLVHRGGARDQAAVAGVSHRRPPPRQAHRRLRRARQGNTLLNYCGIRIDFVEYTVDRNPYKHGRFLPGTHIPIHAPEKIRETRADDVLILPWNLKEEIMEQLAYIRSWGGQFIVPIPDVKVDS